MSGGVKAQYGNEQEQRRSQVHWTAASFGGRGLGEVWGQEKESV